MFSRKWWMLTTFIQRKKTKPDGSDWPLILKEINILLYYLFPHTLRTARHSKKLSGNRDRFKDLGLLTKLFKQLLTVYPLTVEVSSMDPVQKQSSSWWSHSAGVTEKKKKKRCTQAFFFPFSANIFLPFPSFHLCYYSFFFVLFLPWVLRARLVW